MGLAVLGCPNPMEPSLLLSVIHVTKALPQTVGPLHRWTVGRDPSDRRSAWKVSGVTFSPSPQAWHRLRHQQLWPIGEIWWTSWWSPAYRSVKLLKFWCRWHPLLHLPAAPAWRVCPWNFPCQWPPGHTRQQNVLPRGAFTVQYPVQPHLFKIILGTLDFIDT